MMTNLLATIVVSVVTNWGAMETWVDYSNASYGIRYENAPSWQVIPPRVPRSNMIYTPAVYQPFGAMQTDPNPAYVEPFDDSSTASTQWFRKVGTVWEVKTVRMSDGHEYEHARSNVETRVQFGVILRADVRRWMTNTFTGPDDGVLAITPKHLNWAIEQE